MGRERIIDVKISEVKHKLSLARRTLNILESGLFADRYSASNERQKQEAMRLVNSCNADALRGWMREHPKAEIHTLSVRRMRSIARKIGLSNYSRMSSYELAEAIEQYIKLTGDPHELCH